MKLPLKSGKFVLRTTPDLHQRLIESAASAGTSLNDICNQLLEKALGQPASSIISIRELKELQDIYLPLGLSAILLFGSAARGTRTESSDIDVMMVMSDQTPIKRSLYRLWDHETINLHFAQPPVYGEPVSSLWLEVVRDCKIVWLSNDPKIKAALSFVRQSLLLEDYTRKESHGHPYWVKDKVKE
jgi:hypothetical protein